MAVRERPLSPHLQVYRPQLTSSTSIMHRFTGMILSLAAVFLVIGLVTVAHGAEAYASYRALMGSGLGLALFVAFTFSLSYHLLNGIRHLCWDMGRGLDIPTAYASGWAVIIGAVILTGLVAGLALGGAA
ncbi:MAG: succinate dehydrogenase, cytochrome b556 subunit [Xanthomonadales bacterium]|jgi:succinate dehydrogenase / fumarate reductase cytochrome b subunit|nr:succinate dehydrogenase, cytochrome b556 subunit [Xanthomonadales bacterium]